MLYGISPPPPFLAILFLSFFLFLYKSNTLVTSFAPKFTFTSWLLGSDHKGLAFLLFPLSLYLGGKFTLFTMNVSTIVPISSELSPPPRIMDTDHEGVGQEEEGGSGSGDETLWFSILGFWGG